jgi:hypothetical protein
MARQNLQRRYKVERRTFQSAIITQPDSTDKVWTI